MSTGRCSKRGNYPPAMFSFPQKPGVLFARGTDGVYWKVRARSCLVCVNEAEHVASESLESVARGPGYCASWLKST